MTRILVLGDGRYRAAVAEATSARVGSSSVDCDPALGDCVMYVRLEGGRYDGFVFVGWNHPVTRGALAIVAERAILIPLWEPGQPLDRDHDAYLFRLPRALGFRGEDERAAVVAALPSAAELPSEIVGPDASDATALDSLTGLATGGRWQWAGLVEQVAAETRNS